MATTYLRLVFKLALSVIPIRAHPAGSHEHVFHLNQPVKWKLLVP